MTMETKNYSASSRRSGLAMKLAVFSAVYSLAVALLAGFSGGVYDWAGYGAYGLGAIPFAVATLFAVAAAVCGMLAGSASEEEYEKELLRKRKENAQSLLNVAEDVRFTAGRTYRNYVKYAPSVFSLLAFVLMVLGLWIAWSVAATFGEAGPALPKEPVAVSFVCVVIAVFSLFFGAFLAGQSRVSEFRWLRPVGAWMVAGAVIFLLALVPSVALRWDNAGLEMPFAKIAFALIAVVAVEQLFTFITEFYRPRTQLEDRPVHESRLLALFIEPGSVAKNITDALDYQFGFKISGTSLYQMFCKVAIPAIGAWLLILWIFTCVAEVGPGELGLKTRFGALVDGKPLQPGVYLKLPWPCENIQRIEVDVPQTVTIGAVIKSKNEAGKPIRTILWNNEHSSGENPFLVANRDSSGDIGGAVSMLNASLPVTFKVNHEKILDYAFGFENIRGYLLDIGTRQATIYFASTDFMNDLSVGRLEITRRLREQIQQAVDRRGLGVTILNVDLLDTHPPLQDVAPAFQKVFVAEEEMATAVIKAEAYRTRTLAASEIETIELVQQAEAYKFNATTVSSAEARRFSSQLAAYRGMPEMFKLRTYLSFLENDCAPLRKYIISASIPTQILELNAEEKPRTDLTDTDLGDLK